MIPMAHNHAACFKMTRFRRSITILYANSPVMLFLNSLQNKWTGETESQMPALHSCEGHSKYYLVLLLICIEKNIISGQLAQSFVILESAGENIWEVLLISFSIDLVTKKEKCNYIVRCVANMSVLVTWYVFSLESSSEGPVWPWFFLVLTRQQVLWRGSAALLHRKWKTTTVFVYLEVTILKENSIRCHW